MDQRSDNSAPHTNRADFCAYLRERREASQLSLEEISRVTRIPQRSLERLESGRFEELPADVFVRGFLRSYADCVGLDAEDAVRRYAACGLAPAPVAVPEAAALVPPGPPIRKRRRKRRDSESPLAPAHDSETIKATPSVESAEAVAPQRDSALDDVDVAGAGAGAVEAVDEKEASRDEGTPARSSRRRRNGKKHKRRRKRKAKKARSVESGDALESAVADESVESAIAGEFAIAVESAKVADAEVTDSVPAGVIPEDAPVEDEPEAIELVAEPAEDPDSNDSHEALAEVDAAFARSAALREGSGPVVLYEADPGPSRPVLVIDDNDPDAAEREQERRRAGTDTLRSFLPAVLRDPEDTSSRRNTLTLAVIILVIVATLTMSYLLRQPSSSSGDGVTQLDRSGPAQLG